MKQVLIYSVIALLLSCGSSTGGSEKASGENRKATDASATPAVEEVSANQFVITGKILNAPGQQLFLDKYSLNQSQQNISSTTISADGSFAFKGKIDEKGLHLIRLNNNVNWLIALDKGKMNFSADAGNIYTQTVEGSPESQAFSAFILKAGENQNAMNQLNQQFNVARGMGQFQQMATAQQQYQAKHQETQKYLKSNIENSEYSLIAIFAANLLNVEENADYLEKFIEKAEKQQPGSAHVSELKEKIDAATRLALGRVAPDIKIKSPKGETVTLSSTRGKVVLLDFWASWCRPCRIENPNVVKLYDKYQSKGFDIFSVSLDQNMDKWVQAINADNLKWKYHGSTLQGWQCPVAKTYEIQSIPNTLLLDKDGKIIAKNLRGEELAKKLRELFGA